ncbi:MAG: winged helix-turn-helix transcriptional regulator [Bacteroidales bacterium]|nr:winged helix-turn-helix transcriptional regulator [Bacteroidales bacterium]
MAFAKKELFDAEMQECADLYKALSHPARLAIMKYLAETKTCITGDISEEIPLGRTTVNQHLAELKSAGLIQGNIEGVKTYYCLDIMKVKKLKEMTGRFFGTVCCDDNCCEN